MLRYGVTINGLGAMAAEASFGYDIGTDRSAGSGGPGLMDPVQGVTQALAGLTAVNTFLRQLGDDAGDCSGSAADGGSVSGEDAQTGSRCWWVSVTSTRP